MASSRERTHILQAGVTSQHAIFLILLAYLALGTLYSVAVPLFEAPDEDGHYSYVRYLGARGGLPPMPIGSAPGSVSGATPPTDAVSPYVVNHPPLYYVLSGLATRWVRVEPLAGAVSYNPHFDYGVLGLRGNKNAVIHTPAEDFPYQGTSLAVHISRWVSLLLGTGAVVGTYLLSLELFPRKPSLAVCAAALTAFNPQFLFIGARVGNDAAVAGFCSLTMWAAVRFLGREHPGWQPVWLGALLGLALLSKVSAVGMLPVVAVIILIKAIHQRSVQSFLVWSVLTLGTAAVVAGWWYLRNGLLYGDPLLWNVHLELVPRRRPTPSLVQLVQREFGSLEMSFWAVFGWMNIAVAEWIYAILRLLTRLSFLGLLVAGARYLGPRIAAAGRKETSRPIEPNSSPGRAGVGLGMAMLWLVILFLSLLQFMRVQPGAQGRYLFPGISAISLLLIMGLHQWVPARWAGTRVNTVVMASAPGALLLLAVAAPFAYIIPAYAHPSILTADLVPAHLGRLGANFGGQLELLAAKVNAQSLHPGQKAEVTLCWESLAQMSRDYSISLQLVGREEARVGQLDIFPGVGSHPTSLWMIGDIICDDYEVPTYSHAQAPVAARVDVSVYDRGTMKRLPASDSTGRPLGRIVAGRVKIVPETWPPHQISVPVRYTLGDRFMLSGYDLSHEELGVGEQLDITLYWQATSLGDEDYTVFVHLLDQKEQIAAQIDAQPMKGYYPTSFWEQDQLIQDQYQLALPREASAGSYQVEVGMYLLATGQRLPVRDGSGDRVPGDRIILGSVALTVS